MFERAVPRRLLTLLVAALFAAAGCAGGRGSEPQIRIEQAWARPAAGPAADTSSGVAGNAARGGVSAAYFTVVNDGGAPDTLVGVSTDAAAEVSLHRSLHENGIAKMAPVERLVVPAGGRLELRPGGDHVMLMNVTRSLHEGDDVKLVLHFRRSGDVGADARVQAGAPQ